MDMMRMAGFSIAGALTALVLRRLRPELGTAAALGAGILVVLFALPMLAGVVDSLSGIAAAGGVNSSYMTQLMKITGVTLLMDFAAQTCREAGEDALAQKTELAGRAMLLTIALPSMQMLFSRILAIAP